MVHVGLILLLLGQLLTDLLSRESTLHLREGEARNYSETEREAELAVINATDPNTDKVVAISQGVLATRKSLRPGDLPFTIGVKQFFANSHVEDRATDVAQPPAATEGAGRRATVRELPHVTEMDQRDVPSAVVELETPQGSLGTWLVSEFIDEPQSFTWNNRTYALAMRQLGITNPTASSSSTSGMMSIPGRIFPRTSPAAFCCSAPRPAKSARC